MRKLVVKSKKTTEVNTHSGLWVMPVDGWSATTWLSRTLAPDLQKNRSQVVGLSGPFEPFDFSRFWGVFMFDKLQSPLLFRTFPQWAVEWIQRYNSWRVGITLQKMFCKKELLAKFKHFFFLVLWFGFQVTNWHAVPWWHAFYGIRSSVSGRSMWLLMLIWHRHATSTISTTTVTATNSIPIPVPITFTYIITSTTSITLAIAIHIAIAITTSTITISTAITITNYVCKASRKWHTSKSQPPFTSCCGVPRFWFQNTVCWGAPRVKGVRTVPTKAVWSGDPLWPTAEGQGSPLSPKPQDGPVQGSPGQNNVRQATPVPSSWGPHGPTINFPEHAKLWRALPSAPQAAAECLPSCYPRNTGRWDSSPSKSPGNVTFSDFRPSNCSLTWSHTLEPKWRCHFGCECLHT